MSPSDLDPPLSRSILSALVDGEADAGEAAHAFSAWRSEDDDVRTTWHAYHLIGDVLRSEDLATRPSGDQRLLLAVRARLADEAVVVAPTTPARAVDAPPAVRVAQAARAGRFQGRWQAPMAMAAGFIVVVAGVHLVRGGAPGAVQAPVAVAQVPASAAELASVTTPASPNLAAQLAPYLAAHRQWSMGGTFQMPDGDIRNASLVVPGQ